ncbi:TPA: DNA polymerase III subunit delta [Candidatus Saccharibacteria bacterium]|nr:DNA polymerase III subunit delta [Candidatus Saccharibacteria bacterium]HIO87748.1 DNA polymerase III subunit delta [Candidatus Saccharibacteria bacterium]
MTYSFIGTNIHAIRSHIQELFSKSGLSSITRLDGENIALEEIKQSLNGQSLFSTGSFVVIKNLSKHPNLKDKLAEIIAMVGDETTCIFVEQDIDKRKKFFKDLKKLTTYKEINELNPTQAAEFAKGYANQKERDLSSADAAYLVSRVGAEQSRLANELDKLFLYSKTIDKKTIDELTEPTLQDSVFNLTDAISAKNSGKALTIYQSLRQQQVHPMEIMGTLSWHLHTVTQIFYLKNQGSAQQIARAVGLHPFVVEKNLRSVQSLSHGRLKEIINFAIEADESLKTKSLNPDDVVEALLIKLCK